MVSSNLHLHYDLPSEIINAGGVSPYINETIKDTNSLRNVSLIAQACQIQKQNYIPSSQSLKADASLTSAAHSSLEHAQIRLQEIRQTAHSLLEQHNHRQNLLYQLVQKFQNLTQARAQYLAVSKCRQIADAYRSAMLPLALHNQHGTLTDMHTVVSHIRTLIQKVDIVRRKGSKALFADDLLTNQRIIASIENRAVDAIVQARAVFVNVLEIQFRQFGWPMKVPHPQTHSQVISSINFYITQLSHLQRVSTTADYIPQRTTWNQNLSRSWPIATILRAPLARFRYHFLETFKSQPSSNATQHPALGTSRFDRPEWAAEFALDRIREATPFLSQIAIDGPQGADVKFAEGFCQVFAEKIAYDCELALRTSTNDADADSLIAHASEIANQFDAKLRSGIIHIDQQPSSLSSTPSFLSSLHVLSMNESFLTTWASSELRLADARVSELLHRALQTSSQDSSDSTDMPPTAQQTETSTREQLEFFCQEIVNHVGNASEKSRALESEERISTFLKLTETPLLQTIRSTLKEHIQLLEVDDATSEVLQQSARASVCALFISDALEDRSLDSFYVRQEERLGGGFYDDEIARLRSLHSSHCEIAADAIVYSFIEAVRSGYGYSIRFGELPTPNAAVILTHDVSELLVAPLIELESMLTAVTKGIPCRKSASTIWRIVAAKLDAFFFDEIVLQCFAGGTRNAMAVASEVNGFLVPTQMARMARQVAYDASMFMSAFNVISKNPSKFLPSCSECGKILGLAADKVLRPHVAPCQDHEEVFDALKKVADSDEEDVLDHARDILGSRLGIVNITAREGLELCAVAGLRFAIRLI